MVREAREIKAFGLGRMRGGRSSKLQLALSAGIGLVAGLRLSSGVAWVRSSERFWFDALGLLLGIWALATGSMPEVPGVLVLGVLAIAGTASRLLHYQQIKRAEG